MNLPYVPKNDDERRVLSRYSRAIELCAIPEPILTVDEVRGKFQEIGEAVAFYIKKHGTEGFKFCKYPVQIPKGGSRLTRNVLPIVIQFLKDEGELIGDPVDLPISCYSRGGTTRREPKLSEDFELPKKIISNMRDSYVLTIEDIGDSLLTLTFACEYLVRKGAKGLKAFLLIDKKVNKVSIPPELEIAHVAYTLDSDNWVIGADCMDYNSLGRNLLPLHGTYDFVVKPIDTSKLGKKEKERRREFERLMDELKKARVNGVPALDFIESLPPMEWEEILLYQDI